VSPTCVPGGVPLFICVECAVFTHVSRFVGYTSIARCPVRRLSTLSEIPLCYCAALTSSLARPALPVVTRWLLFVILRVVVGLGAPFFSISWSRFCHLVGPPLVLRHALCTLWSPFFTGYPCVSVLKRVATRI